MPPKQLPTLWKAESHTIAKIAILRAYLTAWFQIMGRKRRGQEILYIDGFAGPGRYTNHSEGSPIAALVAAKEALAHSANEWEAGKIHCAFIEEDAQRFAHLEQQVAPFQGDQRIQIHLLSCAFLEGLAQLRSELPPAFSQDHPLFVFVDPFGPTGIPFSTVADLLRSPRSEVLINLDADGIARIFRSGTNSNHEALLDKIMPDGSWRTDLSLDYWLPFSSLCRKVVESYRAGLRSLPNVRYTFPFEMRTSTNTSNYFLLFASQHSLGLEKMKEAMKKIDQTGDYCFSDAHVGQGRLFRFDNPEDFAPVLYQQFRGQVTGYSEPRDFALNETPFLNPKKMLDNLERRRLVEVVSKDPKRRKGTFNEKNILQIKFIEGGCDGQKDRH